METRPVRPSDATNQDTVPAAKLEALLGTSGKGAGRKRRRWLRWAIVALVVLVVAGLAWMFTGNSAAYVYTTSKATRGDLTITVTATGSVQPIDQIDVSSELSGTIRTVHVDYNSPVKAGDVLAELDTEMLLQAKDSADAKMAVAAAAVAKAQATLYSTSKIYDRAVSLAARSVMSTQDLETAMINRQNSTADLNSANAEILVARADQRQAEINLTRAKIVSPIDGVVLTRNAEVGATVAATLSAPVLFTIAGDLSKMQLQVDVDEADVGQVAVDQKATFTVDAYPDQTFPAQITQVRLVSATVQNVVTYVALLSVDNGNGLLRPGMTATADIVVKSVTGALLIPNAALRYSPPVTATSRRSGVLGLFRPPRSGAITAAEPTGAERTIWVLRNQVPTPVNVKIGSSDGKQTAVLSGDIAEGDELIVDASASSS